MLHSPTRGKRLPGTKLLPRAIEGYLIGYTSSDKIYRIYFSSQHKVTETRQIHWTTKMIASLGITTMELLLAEKTNAEVDSLSCPLPRIKIEKNQDQESTTTTTTPEKVSLHYIKSLLIPH